MTETLSRGERLVQLAALRKLFATGSEESARQAVELARAFGDGPLLEALAEGVSVNRDGILVVDKKSEVHRRLKAEARNTVALRLVAAAGKLKAVDHLSWDVSGQRDLSELWSAVELHTLMLHGCGSLEDLSVLASMPKLRRLYLRAASPTLAFAPLGQCRALAHLEIQADGDSVPEGASLDLSLLAPLPQLQHLEVSGLPVSGLAHLASFRALRRLDVLTVPGA